MSIVWGIVGCGHLLP
jgi:hypothetical protein